MRLHSRRNATGTSSISAALSAEAVRHAPLIRLVGQRFSWALAVWLHLGLFAIVGSLSQAPPAGPQPALEVDLVPAAAPPPTQAATPSGPARAPSRPTPGSSAAPAEEPGQPPPPEAGAAPGRQRPDTQVWVSARTFLAAGVLQDPRSRQARMALATLAGADRREQICALEAMEQLRRTQPGFRPTRLAPHAFRNASFGKGLVDVTAGAVRSNRIWYEIAYRCRLDASGTTVVGFEHALGAEIERALWDAHGLAPVH